MKDPYDVNCSKKEMLSILWENYAFPEALMGISDEFKLLLCAYLKFDNLVD